MISTSRLFLIGYDGMNHPLLRRFLAEGELPNFASLLKHGSLNRILPSLPPWTPTNWASIVTGAPAGTHQLGGWSTRGPNGDSVHRVLAWDAAALGGAETLWDVADKAGRRCLVTHYPAGSWNRGLRNGYVVAPGVHEAPFSCALSTKYVATTRPRQVRPAQASTAAAPESSKERATDVEEQGATPGQEVVQLLPALKAGWEGVGELDLAATLPLRPRRSGEPDELFLLVCRPSLTQLAGLWICAERRRDAALVEVPLKRWGEFALLSLRHLGEVSMRFAALDVRLSAADATIVVVRSLAYATRGFASPDGLDAEILDSCGPFFDLYALDPDIDDDHLDLWLDEMRYMGEWEVRVADYVGERYGWDLHFSHWHAFDWINHVTANGLDPSAPGYDPAKADWLLDAQRRTYKTADQILGQFLQLEQDGDLVCVVADHGITATHRYGDAARRLEEVGLLKRTPTGKIDSANCSAYFLPERGAEIFVNLEGRESNGIVSPHDYSRVQEAIIDALLDWRDPVNGRRVCALALKAEDAQLVGYWGPEAGDVVYIHNRGFGWGQPAGFGSVGDGRVAIHGSQIPTSENDDLSNLGCLVIAGPEVRVGYERDWQRWGLMRMVDLAPTIATRLGLPVPRHSNGAVLSDLFVSQ